MKLNKNKSIPNNKEIIIDGVHVIEENKYALAICESKKKYSINEEIPLKDIPIIVEFSSVEEIDTVINKLKKLKKCMG